MSTTDNSTSEITSSTSKSALTEAAPCPISADAPTPLDLSDTDVSSCDRDDFAKVSLAGIRSGNTTYGRGKFKDKSGKNYFERRGFIFGPEADLSESQLTGTAGQYILLEGKNLEKLDFSNSTLAYIDLYGTTLDEAKLNGAMLKNIDARNTALKRADLSGCTINQVSYLNLKEAILKDFDLSQGNTNYLKTDNERSTSNKYDINLKGGNFSEKIFTEPEQSVLKNIDLTEGIFENAKLDNVDLTGASLYKAKLNGATLEGTKLNGAVLVGATNVVLKGAELEGFDFEQKKDSKQLDLQEIDLRGANFSDISFENIENSELFLNLKLNDIDFTDADISKLNLGETTDLRGAILKDATMGVSQNINLIGANFNELDGNKFNKSFFKDKDLSETQFQNARFSNHNFSGATLTGAYFTDAVMDGVILNGAIGANLSGTKLNKFDLAQEGFSRQETNLTEADFSGTNKRPFKHYANEIKESLFDGINLQGANFKNLTLKDISFAGADLKDAIFENTTLHNPILNKDNNANTEEDSEKGLNESNDIDPNNNSSEEQSKAININLSGAILEDFDFDQGVNLGSSFSNTTFKSTRNNEKINSIDIFIGANFTNAIFRTGFNLQGLNLTGATFNSTDFNQVSLRDVKLADVNLFNNSNLDLTGANLQNFDLNQISELHTKLDIEDLFQEIRTPVQESASNNSDVVGIAITSNNTDPDDGYWTYSVDSGENWLLLPTNLSEENALFLDDQAQFKVFEYNQNRTITNKLKAKAVRPEDGRLGSPAFKNQTRNPFGLKKNGINSAPAFADIDNDGDLDAFIGNQQGKTTYFENTGQAGEEKFIQRTDNPFGLLSVDQYASPAFADIDNDGDLDAFIGNLSGSTSYFENIDVTPSTLDLTKSGAQHNFTTDQEYSLSGEYTSSTNDIPRNSLKEVDLTGENFADKNVDQELIRDNYPKEILKGYNLQGSNFTDANLTGIDLSNTDLANAVLKNAILNGTKLENAVNVNLSGARLNGFNFNQDNLNLLDEYSETDFTGIDFQKINNKTIFVGSTFNQSIFTNAKLDGHNLRDTSFTNIENLEAITFEKAKLKRAQFNGTGTLNLQGADLRGFDLNQESLAENGTIRLKQKLIDVNLKGENISAYGKPEILKGFDLTQSDLKNSTLDDLNLSNTTLYGVSFDGASLSRTTLSGATDVNLSGAKLNDFDFNQANLDIVGNFYQTKFGNNNLEEITNKNFFENQEFNESILNDASFNGHNLSNSKFINIDNLNTISFGKSILNGVVKRTSLKGAQFNGTGTLNLQGADLREFNLNQASLANGELSLNNKLSDVNLQGEDFSAYGKPEILQGFDLSESILIGTTFDGLDLSQTKLKGAQLQGASFKDTILKNTNFSNATDFNLNGADIRSLSILKFIPVETEINGVDFSHLIRSDTADLDLNILKDRKFVKCNFDGVDLKQFNLTNTIFTDSQFDGTSFKNSNLTNTIFNNPNNLNLSRANLQEFDFAQTGLDIKTIKFKNANIKANTTLQRLNLKEINFQGALLDGANLAGADLTKTNLTSASLSDAIFADDQGYRAEFNNTNLDGATVNTLEGAILSGLVAPEAFYKGLNLKNVEFAGNKSLIGANFTGSDLTDANLSDTNLSEAKFKNTTLNGTNFTNATLTDTQFINSDLSNAILNSLKGSDLSKIDASSIFGRSLDLSDVNLEGQDLTGIDLTNEKLSNANLNRTKLINTIARNTDLNGASFEDAILDNTILETNKLSSLAYADLRNFDLKAIEDRIQNGEIALTGVNLKGKRINNIDLTNAELNEAQFQRSRLSDVTLSGSNLHQADFTDAWIMDSVFEEEADLNQAILDKTEIRFSRFNDAKLISASLKGADIYRGRFDHANLEGADLHKASFGNLGLRGATLDQAVLYKTVFDNVELEQATFTDSIWDQTRIDRAHDLSLKGADLSQFNLSKLDKKYQNFDAIKLRDNSYINIDLDGYQMKGADLSNATFNEGTMIGTNFSALLVNREDPDGDESSYTTQTSDFSKSTFKDVDLTNAKLKDANLKKASFEDVTFTKTIFQGASLKNTTFINPIDLNLRGADLREFDISQLDLRSTSLRKTDLRNQDFTGFDFHGGRSVPIRYGNSEYELISAGSWQEASKAAKEQGGHLLVVNSNAELNVVAELLQDESTEKNTAIDAWIGYSQPTQDAAWQWETNSQNALQLVADISKQSATSRAQFSILQASSIAAAQQSAKNQGGQLASTLHAIPLDLLAANTKYWTNYSHAPFDDNWSINRKELSGSEKSLLNQSISNGLKINVSDNDFDYVGVDGRNWYFANKNAKAIGGELTSRTNFSINEINEITGETNPTVVWIGLNKDHSTNDWKWSGRPGPSPIPWKSGQPTGGDQYFGALKLDANAYQVHDIAFVSAGASGIAEIPIYRNGYYGILQKNNNNQLTLTSEPSGHYQGVLEIQKSGPAYAAINLTIEGSYTSEAIDSFPTLFSSTKKTYEKIYNQPSWISWDEARQDARNRGGYLGNITSEAELQRIIGQGIKGNYWISGIDNTSTHQYEWADGPEQGEVFWDNGPINDKYSIFRSTDPNNTNHQCVMMIGDHSVWDDLPCSVKGPYLLEKDFSTVGIALVGNTTAANGEDWQYSVDGGINWTSVPADLSESNALYLNQSAQLRVIKPQDNHNENTILGDGLIAKTVFEVPTDPEFKDPTNNPFGLEEVGFHADPAFADLDNDGDLDAFIGNSAGDTVYFENTGQANEPQFEQSENNPFGLKDIGLQAAPAFADLDNDGDLDALIGNSEGDTVYCENTSNPPERRIPGMLYNFSNEADFELSEASGSIESLIDPNLQDIVDTKIVFDGDSINHAIIERPVNDADYEIDLKGANLTGTILSGANLSYANLNKAQLKNVDFTDTILRGAKMKDTLDLDLTRADLRGFDITQVDLKNTSLEHVDLSGENLTGLNLSEAKLKGANLQNAILINANLTGIDLRNADLRGAKLNGAILKNARLSEAKGVNLQGTNLEGFDMGQVELAGQDLSNTNLEGQTISNTSLTKTNLTNANLKNATLNNVGLNSAILTGAELEGATLNDVTLDGVADLDLEGSRLTGDPEALQTVSLDQIDLTQSTLQEKNFDGLNLQGLDFSGVDLTGSTFIGTRLQGAIFDRANLTNVDFTDATLKNVSIENIQLDNGKKLLLDDADLKNFDLAQLDELGHDQFSLIGADLSGLDFNNLSDQHLKDLNFNETTLTGASFDGTTLEGNKFIGSDLSETTFKNATINNAIFNNATGDHLTNFRNATFTNATFKNSTFDQSNFSKTKFDGTLIVKGNVFDNSNFNQSDLSPSLANTSDWFNITCPNGSNNQNNLFACPSA